VSGRVFQIGNVMHRQVQTLLPWYVGSSLDAEDRARVETHLAECPRCRAELALERALRAACADGVDDALVDVDRGFALLRERIAADRVARQPRPLATRLWRSWQADPAWLRWVLMGQCAAALLLSALLLMPPGPGPYRALGGSAATPASATGGNLIVRFRPEATEQEIRRALRDSDARLVYGPTTTDAYLLAVPAGREKAVVARLRKESSVLLVESLEGGGTP
jgi:anti-sigma factor RsiW